MSTSFSERFLGTVCPYRPILYALIGVQGVFFALLVFALWAGRPDAYTRAIIVVNFVVVSLVLVASTYLLYRCVEYDRDRPARRRK